MEARVIFESDLSWSLLMLLLDANVSTVFININMTNQFGDRSFFFVSLCISRDMIRYRDFMLLVDVLAGWSN